MKDLKHLIFFEKLLENAENELVKKAIADGDSATLKALLVEGRSAKEKAK